MTAESWTASNPAAGSIVVVNRDGTVPTTWTTP
jgi:hypothetical protein